ncbi:MAG: hypothetical protein KF752_20220 [Pirellulaceae bacterium]|nr:hypothetical protein [Pirellulaceae bacterium]
MLLDRSTLDRFELKNLQPRKRTTIRRALEACQIQLIPDVEADLERIRLINVSQAQRQANISHTAESIERYTAQADDWRAQIRQEARLPGRQWWGAYIEGNLVAYLRSYQVGNRLVIQQVKSDTNYLKSSPVDALYYSVLSQAASDPSCDLIFNGEPMHASLNQFKELYLFRAVDLPVYSSNAMLINFYKQRLLRHSQAASTVHAS